MNCGLPKIVDDGTLSGDCKSVGGQRELHAYCRTVPFEVRSSSSEDVLQDEDGFPILDEQTVGKIYDDLRY